MSLFSKLAPAGPTEEEKNEQLNVRYNHLQQYAELLNVDALPLIARANLGNGLTDEALDTLQMLIESAAEQAEMRTGQEMKRIDSAEMLDWYFEKLVVINAEIAAITEQMEKALAGPKAMLKSFEYLYGEQAKQYAEARYKLTGKKTEHFPHGSITVRTEQPKWTVGDEGMLQAWLENLEAVSKAKFEVYPKTWTRNLDAIKAAAANGSKIPGLQFSEGGDKVTLKLPKVGA